MARKTPVLLRIDHDQPVSEEFLYHLQSALLLALQERGHLNMIQYNWAMEALNRQRQERARRLLP